MDGAIADYDHAIRLQPDDAGAYNNRGASRMEKGDLDGAIADYDEAIRLNSDDAAAYYSRGTVHEENTRFSELMPVWSLAVPGADIAALLTRRADLLRRVYNVDPPFYSRYASTMRIVGVITNSTQIKRILDHLRTAPRGRAPRDAKTEFLSLALWVHRPKEELRLSERNLICA